MLRELTFHIAVRETEAKARGEKRSEVASSGHRGTSTTVTSQWEAGERSQTPSALTHEYANVRCPRRAKEDTETSGYQKLWDGRNPRRQLMNLGFHFGMMKMFWN